MNSIFKKGLLLIAVPLLFQGIFLAVLLANERASVEAESWALHTQLVISQAQAALRHLVEESNRVRGLVITGNPVFGARPADPSDPIAELHRLVRDNPIQLHRVEALAATAARLSAWFTELEGLVRTGRAGDAGERIRSFGGERLLKDAKAQIADFLA